MTGPRAPRSWRPGRHFGRRLTRLPPLPRPEVPLYALGTAVRIERVRLLYQDGVAAAAVVRETPIIQNGFVPSPAANDGPFISGHGTQAARDGEQPLLDAVSGVPLNPAASLLAGDNDAGARGGEAVLRSRVLSAATAGPGRRFP